MKQFSRGIYLCISLESRVRVYLLSFVYQMIGMTLTIGLIIIGTARWNADTRLIQSARIALFKLQQNGFLNSVLLLRITKV